MKKFFSSFILFVALSIMVKGQFTKLGGGVEYNSGFHFNNEKFPDHKTGNPVLFLKGIYELSLPFHISPSLNVFIPNVTKTENVSNGYTDKISIRAFSLDINGHYVINSLDKVEFYGLAGFNFLLMGRKSTLEGIDLPEPVVNKDKDNALGLNIGAGSYIKLRDSFDLFVEVKGIISSQFQFVTAAGILLNIDWLKKNENPAI